MKGVCPNCEKVVDIELIQQQENLEIRGDVISIDVEFFKCQVCDTEFRDHQTMDDPLEIAYKKYREKHSLIQPEEIRRFRNEYQLTQQELSNLLGWGGATLSRYENGALQDDAHNTTLKLAMEPRNLLSLIKKKSKVLGKVKREKLLDVLSGKEAFISVCETRFGSYDPSQDSGYKKLDITKLLNAMVFFCKGKKIPKTKLNKLLFYADFKHFKEYTVSITGVKYAHLPFGPVPDQYQYYLASLFHDENSIEIEEKDFGDYTGEYLLSTKEPDLSVFSASELKILATIKEVFEGFTASDITQRSHEEQGYKETIDGEIISYLYAEMLSL